MILQKQKVLEISAFLGLTSLYFSIVALMMWIHPMLGFGGFFCGIPIYFAILLRIDQQIKKSLAQVKSSQA